MVECSHFYLPSVDDGKLEKTIKKVADVVLTIPAGSTLWPQALHEPVVLGLICLLLNCSPWQVRNSGGLVELATTLPREWSSDWRVEGDSLRKFWREEVPEHPSMLWGLARRMLLDSLLGTLLLVS
jgi:hypothetical protein